MRYRYLNPPSNWGTNGQPYELAYLSDQRSEERCVPPLADAVSSSPLPQTPIIISLTGQYDLTSVSEGVRFDINADAHREQVAWTAPNSDLAFLAQDRNGNGLIDSGAELFGEYTLLSNGTNAGNGFNALADLDGNLDGRVDSADPSWQTLLLWFDRDHDGVSTPEELLAIGSSDVMAVSTLYRWTGRKDKFGNEFRYKGEVELSNGKRACYDVFLNTIP